MNPEDKRLHDCYERLPFRYRQPINAAYEAATDSLGKDGLTIPGDDRAEQLIAAITRYVLSGNPAIERYGLKEK